MVAVGVALTMFIPKLTLLSAVLFFLAAGGWLYILFLQRKAVELLEDHGFSAASPLDQAGRIAKKLFKKGWITENETTLPSTVLYSVAATQFTPGGRSYFLRVFRRIDDKQYIIISGMWDTSEEWKNVLPTINESAKKMFQEEVNEIRKNCTDYSGQVWPPEELRFEMQIAFNNASDGPLLMKKVNLMKEWEINLDHLIRNHIDKTGNRPPKELLLTMSRTTIYGVR